MTPELTDAQKGELRDEIGGGPRAMFGILGLKGQAAMTSEKDSSLPIYEGLLKLFRWATADEIEDAPKGKDIDAALAHLAFLVVNTTIRDVPLATLLTDAEVKALKLLGDDPGAKDVTARRESLIAEEEAALDHERDRRDAFAAIVAALGPSDGPAG